MINNILIIEDEKPNADRLKRLIHTLRPNATILTVLESVSESVTWLQANEKPDLIMMDVRLADGISFEIFEQVRPKCPVIFTTAYDEYAVRAFKFNSIDYLLKPIEQEELEIALDKADGLKTKDLSESIEALRNSMTVKEYRTRFLLPYRDGYKTILASDIAFICSELKITKAKLFDTSEEVLFQTLEELEQQLDPKLFFRANRQFIIHVNSIRQIHNYFNGKLKVELKKHPEVEVVISREKAVAFKSWLDY